MAAAEQDPLLLLRQSITTKSAILPTASDASSSTAGAPPEEVSLALATHLTFTTATAGFISLPIDVPTRFASDDEPVDLRSIYFAWLNGEAATLEYNEAAEQLNAGLLAGGQGQVRGQVRKLSFAERLDLITWLQGASEESEYIRPLAGDKDGATSAAAAAAASAVGGAPGAGRSGKGTLDPRLAAIYSSERKMGDRNSVLRGIKPTLIGIAAKDFSHVRKYAAIFMSKKALQPSTVNLTNPAIASHQKPKRPDPIILLSPSASSLLRMSNVKSFLESGTYVPPDSAAASSSTGASMLHINRLMKDVDPSRPMRFILVEGPEQFKPEYWNRVVAVFTTGQSWQFKNYKWSSPPELFRHIPGIYVGWRGEQPPESVAGWGHRVLNVGVDRWKETPHGVDTGRWRDREVVEGIWKMIEGNMRSKGWRRDQAPSSI
ncbi:accessory factor associated with RNA polymerase II [Diatrype stigma]|uniref:Accessory factor associated with RNA polymerase II n=1 Tax=Diatrype stigma TaxID=117547 RepID=A0AAN9UYL6_9PEZI